MSIIFHQSEEITNIQIFFCLFSRTLIARVLDRVMFSHILLTLCISFSLILFPPPGSFLKYHDFMSPSFPSAVTKLFVVRSVSSL